MKDKKTQIKRKGEKLGQRTSAYFTIITLPWPNEQFRHTRSFADLQPCVIIVTLGWPLASNAEHAHDAASSTAVTPSAGKPSMETRGVALKHRE